VRFSPFWLLVMGILVAEFISSGTARKVYEVIVTGDFAEAGPGGSSSGGW
jgi:hypothetical protein